MGCLCLLLGLVHQARTESAALPWKAVQIPGQEGLRSGDCWLPPPVTALSRELLHALVHLLPDHAGVAVRTADR